MSWADLIPNYVSMKIPNTSPAVKYINF